MSPAPSPSTAIASLLVANLSIQTGASIAKQLFPLVGAPTATALRLGLSAGLVLLWQRPWRAVPSRAAWPIVATYGAVLGVMNFSFYMAIATVPLGIAVALEFTGPLAVAIAGSRRPRDLVWVALAAVGVFFLLPVVPQDAAPDPVGVAYALAAGVCWALYIVCGQRAGHLHGAAAAAWGMLIAAAIVVPPGLLARPTGAFTPRVLALGLVVAVLSSAVPYTLEMVALRRLSARAFGTLMSLDPAVASLAGAVLLGERLSPGQWLSIAAITAASMGVVASERPSAPQDRRDGPDQAGS